MTEGTSEKDLAETSAFALEAMKTMVGEGLFSGDENGRMNPKATATRAEAAQLIYYFKNEAIY